jgi:fatty acid desaturase
MSQQVSIARNAAVEWPTVLLFAAIHGSFLVLTWFHAAIPLWLWLPWAAWMSAWWGSAQHEALHGHPTRLRWLNTALATPPYWLWLPYERYKQMHLTHHRDERLTDPIDDPESRYWTPEGWKELGPLGQALVKAQGTMLGRLTIGPFWSVAMFWRNEAAQILAGDRKRAAIWGWHALWVTLLGLWVFGVCGVPVWQYLLGAVFFGTSIAMIRSFAEHRAEHEVEKRTAIVENSPLFGLLFLHNNLHVVHHKWPTVAWYKLPALYREHREALIRENGGLLYNGYRDVFRRFLLRRHHQPVHPFGRAPDAAAFRERPPQAAE